MTSSAEEEIRICHDTMARILILLDARLAEEARVQRVLGDMILVAEKLMKGDKNFLDYRRTINKARALLR